MRKMHIRNLVFNLLGIGVLALMSFGFIAVAATSNGEIASNERLGLAVLGFTFAVGTVYALIKGVRAGVRCLKTN